jgi:nucleoside-diphosphate-sugar epimerase
VSPDTDRRVLVTGASGFVGRAVLPHLEASGYEVHVVTHRNAAQGMPGVRAHRLDLLDGPATEALVGAVRPSHLLHLAWYTTPERYLSSDRNLAWVEASLRLVRSFAAAGGERAVVAGTCAEYDLTDGRCSEATTPRRPGSLYGVCKNALFEMATAHALSAGYSLAWARLFHAYGPAERPERLVPSVVRNLLERRPVQLSHGRQERDFVFVEDVGCGLVRLLDSELDGAVNVGSGEATSVRSVVAAIADRIDGPTDVHFGGRGGGDGGPPRIVADGSRLKDELGWEPSVQLAEGIDRTVSWWRERLGS